MNVVELCGGLGRQAAIALARKRNAQSSTEYLFIGGHPLHAQTLSESQNFFRNTSFGRPNSLRTDAENSLVQIKATLKLLSSVLGMTKAMLRQRQSRGGNCAHIRVTDQRKNRMVER